MNGQAETRTMTWRQEKDTDWSWMAILQLVALAAAAGLLLAVFGPFGTYSQMDWSERLIFWETVLLSAAALHVPILWIANRAGCALGLPAPLWVAGAGALAALPTTLMITGLIATLYGYSRPPNFAGMYLFVASISLPMQALSYGVLRLGSRTSSPCPFDGPEAECLPPETERETAQPETATPTANPPLLDRLPAHLGSDILCLEMEDHYVRVRTTLGSAMLLMRMVDAEAALSEIDGARVHRSWWVRRDAIERVETRGRQIDLILTNGLTVPVSRYRAAFLRKRGWFAAS